LRLGIALYFMRHPPRLLQRPFFREQISPALTVQNHVRSDNDWLQGDAGELASCCVFHRLRLQFPIVLGNGRVALRKNVTTGTSSP